ncbi:hypothetical protein SUGI_0845420 [Cryptomeria japonica]|uniref:plant intracellular Ras-group-related LRR protein 4 n=1 Tax=Cryptomeria japonica TaxID=3369 RepID=UPI00241482A4|nr:plant intracellular Ras-group-related LRR protein 4 [Cryptomeria japonica]GLJ40867.1 hypothetical protein SUGI_0845420 [Cryptomeria japonica]
MNKSAQTVADIVEEIMRLHRSLPPRPSFEEFEAAIALVKDVESKEQSQIEMIMKQQKPSDVPFELFAVLQEMQKNFVCMKSQQEKREALDVIDLERYHRLFDDWLQKAYGAIQYANGNSNSSRASWIAPQLPNGDGVVGNGGDFYLKEFEGKKKQEVVRIAQYSKDDSFIQKPKVSYSEEGIRESEKPRAMMPNSFVKPSAEPGSGTGDGKQKFSLIKIASVFEATAKTGAESLDLQGKLLDQLEWLPDSIGKLTSLVQLNLSENRIVILPSAIGGLTRLTKLDLHSNQLHSLPDSIGELSSLTELDLRGNRLTKLPATIGNISTLVNLDVSSNHLSSLPESIGQLTNLKILSIGNNEIEELPYTIGQCTALVELRADFNNLKALPEAVGKLVSLEVLTLHYNRVKNLPTTLASLASLKELDVSFNELESVPESLCFATNLVKLNVGRNFADLRSLPRSIGNLEMLEELDISSNQIKVLPDSFALLKRLRVLHVEEIPLEYPPIHIAEKGAQAVVQYMSEEIAKREEKSQATKPKRKRASYFQCLITSIWTKRNTKNGKV